MTTCLFRGLLALLLAGNAALALAQSGQCIQTFRGNTVCPPAKSICVVERDGLAIKCSPKDGGIVADRYGKAACGKGACILDFHGEPVCSRDEGGSAAIDISSTAVCTGGCEKAQASWCSTLTP